MNLFKKKKPAPGSNFNADVNKAHVVNGIRQNNKEARQRRIEDISAVLHDCRFTFQKTITVENALANEMRLKGYPTTKQHARVRDAAIGILVVEQALYELKSINSESDLNSAMNKMGMALRQLKRVDNSSAAVSTSTERIIRQWYPDGLTAMEENEEAESISIPEVPEDIVSIIDENFVQNMMMGDSFDMAMFKRNLAPKVDPTREGRDELMNKVRAAARAEEPAQADYSGVVAQFDNKF